VLALLWEGAKHLFSTYVQDLAVIYGRMYGSLLVVVMFLLWVYYSAVLFLYGAAIVHRLQVGRERPR
jgi:membrane protein